MLPSTCPIPCPARLLKKRYWVPAAYQQPVNCLQASRAVEVSWKACLTASPFSCLQCTQAAPPNLAFAGVCLMQHASAAQITMQPKLPCTRGVSGHSRMWKATMRRMSTSGVGGYHYGAFWCFGTFFRPCQEARQYLPDHWLLCSTVTVPEHLRTSLEDVLLACVEEVPSLEPVCDASLPKSTRQVGKFPPYLQAVCCVSTPLFPLALQQPVWSNCAGAEGAAIAAARIPSELVTDNCCAPP